MNNSEFTPQPEFEPSDRQNNNLPLVVAFIVFLLISLLANLYFILENKKLNNRIQRIESDLESQLVKEEIETTENSNPNEVNQVTDLDEDENEVTNKMSSWERFESSKFKFSVDIPKGWRNVESFNMIGFGPKEIGEDVLISVAVYLPSDTSMSDIIDLFGKQFSDRVQKTNTINVNGNSATEIITTTPSMPTWYHRAVIVDNEGTMFVLSNGAVKDTAVQGKNGVPEDYTFETFVQSFQVSR